MGDVFLYVLFYALGGFFMYYHERENLAEGRNAVEIIAQCEAELPRNQHCELVAVPVTEVSDGQ